MHPVVAAHLKDFASSRDLQNDTLTKQFEKFSNYSVIHSRTAVDIDIETSTTGDDDDGIDGVAALINEEAIGSSDDAERILSGAKRNNEVELIFVQAKSGESFDLGDFLKFKEGILRFCSPGPYESTDDVLAAHHEVFNAIVKNVSKLRDGKPSLIGRFVTTGIYRSPGALESAKAEAIRQIEDLGYFSRVDLDFIDRDALTKLWVSTYSGTDATIDLFSVAALPTIAGVGEAYLGVVKAIDLVTHVLANKDGSIRPQVFQENVRYFLGTENAVNSSIAKTLESTEAATRFPVLNNGITIVSPDVVAQGNRLHIKNYQIVNGCQTSHILWESRDKLTDKVMVHVKVVETANEDIFAELVRATNSQTKVEEKQFFSLRPIVKKIETYFESMGDRESRLHLERRSRQYLGQEIPVFRIFSVDNVAKAVCSMFLLRPDLAQSYPKRMYEALGEQIFADDAKEIVFYASALALHRVHGAVANAKISQGLRRYKWHMLPLMRRLISGENVAVIKLNSNKLEKQCERIVRVFEKQGEEQTRVLTTAAEAVQKPKPTRAGLKGQAVLTEMLNSLDL